MSIIPQADPAAARKMLAEAGHPDGIKMPMIVPVGRPLRERLGVTLQQLLKPAGFDLQIQRAPYSTFPAEVSGKAPLYIDGFFQRPTIDASTYPFLHTGASWNEQLWHYNNPDVDKALETARTQRRSRRAKDELHRHAGDTGAVPPGMFAYVTNFACAFRGNRRRHENPSDALVRPPQRHAELTRGVAGGRISAAPAGRGARRAVRHVGADLRRRAHPAGQCRLCDSGEFATPDNVRGAGGEAWPERSVATAILALARAACCTAISEPRW